MWTWLPITCCVIVSDMRMRIRAHVFLRRFYRNKKSAQKEEYEPKNSCDLSRQSPVLKIISREENHDLLYIGKVSGTESRATLVNLPVTPVTHVT